MNPDKSVVLYFKKNSAASEAYKILRTNLLFSKDGKSPKVIVVTSARAGEGKTTTASNIAVAFMQTRHKTLLIDADMRKPNVHQKFNLSRLKGLSTLLNNASTLDETIQHTDEPLLDIITAGPTSRDSTELLSSKTLKDTFDELRAIYDIIIVDTPPVCSLTDATLISLISDGVVLVVGEGAISMRDIKASKEHIEKVGSSILGVVYNKIGSSMGVGGKYYMYYKYQYYNKYYYGGGYYNEDVDGNDNDKLNKKSSPRRRKRKSVS